MESTGFGRDGQLRTRRFLPRRTAAVALAAFVLAGSAGAPVGGASARSGATPTSTPTLFDDFNYPSTELAAHGWYVRSQTGGPGAPGAGWSPAGVSIVQDPAQGANRLLRLEAMTDGTVAGTSRAEVDVVRAASVKAPTLPVSDSATRRSRGSAETGPWRPSSPWAASRPSARPGLQRAGLRVPPERRLGRDGATMFMTSWDTYEEAPLVQKLTHTLRPGSLSGWHTLVIQVGGAMSGTSSTDARGPARRPLLPKRIHVGRLQPLVPTGGPALRRWLEAIPGRRRLGVRAA